MSTTKALRRRKNVDDGRRHSGIIKTLYWQDKEGRQIGQERARQGGDDKERNKHGGSVQDAVALRMQCSSIFFHRLVLAQA
jgi:hypothetical protein